jgi:aryl sulfotransferase
LTAAPPREDLGPGNEDTNVHEPSIVWPKKTREQQWAVWDSTRLNDFPFRSDDIMIATWSKCGTTWVQQIVAQLVFKGDPQAFGQERSPWIEFRLMSKEDAFAMAAAQTHRRFLKTHSPLEAIPFRPDVKYLYIGRDARDVVWSMYHHHSIFTPGAYAAFNEVPGRVGAPMAPPGCDVREYYLHFLEHGFFPGFPAEITFWSHVQGWWEARHLPNVLLVHYANLQADFEGQARRIAAFLDIEVDDALWPTIREHCSIGHMRELAAKFTLLEQIFEGGGRSFINKGTNGRWKDVLSEAEIRACDEVAARHLSADCAHWLKTGESSAG